MSVFCWPLRVYYEDTDCGGVVYHASYLKFMERARTEWLRGLGYEQDNLVRDQRVIFAVQAMDIAFVKPARFNERLTATAEPREVRAASLKFQQSVVRPSETGDDELLVKASVRVACLCADRLKPIAIPATLHQVLKRASRS